MPSSPVAGVSWASRQLAIRLPRLFTKPTRPPRRFILTACITARTSAGTINKARLRETDASVKNPAPFPPRGCGRSAGTTKQIILWHRTLRRRLAPQCRRIWRPVFVLGLLFLLDRLFRRNDPLESAIFAHGSLEEVRSARQQRQKNSHEIGRIFAVGLLRLAALDQLDHFRKTLLGGFQTRDAGIVLLD